jgi:xylulokinase
MHLGLDIGTSAVKAVLIEDDGTFLADASGHLTVSRPHSGWSEQDPDAWIAAVEAALDQLAGEHRAALAAVKGIGLSGQMHGATLLDAADRPLRPAILWNDVRSFREAAELDADPRFRALTGNIVFPGFTAPKLVWVARNEPQIAAQVRSVLLPKDYVRLWLSGDHASDMSDSAGTAWLDVAGRRWSGELLAATGLDERHMPKLYEGTQATGTLRPDLAARWGMGGEVAIAGGAGDNAASACGVGCVAPGSAFVSLGTSGVLFTTTESFRPNAASAVHTFCHALPATWHQMGVILSAAGSFEWLTGVTGRSPADLTAALGEDLAPPCRVKFFPYLSGERTPHNDALVRGAFVGLDHAADATVLAQAVLEGVAFALRDNLEALAAAGTVLSRMMAIGGGSRSRYWLKVIATALNLPVDVPAQGEFGAAVGAARLGLVAATGADPLAVCSAPALAETIDPETALVSAFGDHHARWQALYPSIKGASS